MGMHRHGSRGRARRNDPHRSHPRSRAACHHDSDDNDGSGMVAAQDAELSAGAFCAADCVEPPAVTTVRYHDPRTAMAVVGCGHARSRLVRRMVRLRTLRVAVDRVHVPWHVLLRRAPRPVAVPDSDAGSEDDDAESSNPVHAELARCRERLLDELEEPPQAPDAPRAGAPLLQEPIHTETCRALAGAPDGAADAAAVAPPHPMFRHPLQEYFVALSMRRYRQYSEDVRLQDDACRQRLLAFGRQLTPTGYAMLCTYGSQLVLEPEHWSDAVLPFHPDSEAHATVVRHLSQQQLLCDLRATPATSLGPDGRYGEVVMYAEELMLQLGAVFGAARSHNPLQHVVWAREALADELRASRDTYEKMRVQAPPHVRTLREARAASAQRAAAAAATATAAASPAAAAPPDAARSLAAAMQWHAEAMDHVRHIRLLALLVRMVDAFLRRVALLAETFHQSVAAARREQRREQRRRNRVAEEERRRREAADQRRAAAAQRAEEAARAQDAEVAAFASRLQAVPAERRRALPAAAHAALRALFAPAPAPASAAPCPS